MKPLPTKDEIERYQWASDALKDLHAHAKAMGYAPFDSFGWGEHAVWWAKNRGTIHLMWGHLSTRQLPGAVRVRLVEELLDRGLVDGL